MTRDEAIEAGARAIDPEAFLKPFSPIHPRLAKEILRRRMYARERAAAVLDAIGWVEPVGYLAPGVTALINAYPTLEEARASGWGGDMYALVPVEGDG